MVSTPPCHGGRGVPRSRLNVVKITLLKEDLQQIKTTKNQLVSERCRVRFLAYTAKVLMGVHLSMYANSPPSHSGRLHLTCNEVPQGHVRSNRTGGSKLVLLLVITVGLILSNNKILS